MPVQDYGIGANKPIAALITQQQQRQVQQLCKLHGVTKSALVRQMIDQLWEAEKAAGRVK